MQIKGKPYTAIWPNEDKTSVSIIDQLFLPFEFRIKKLRTVEDSYQAIKTMEVRGAPLIGITAAFGMYFATLESSDIKKINEAGDYLKSSRPTAVNLMWAVDKVMNAISSSDNYIEAAFEEAIKIYEGEIKDCKLIGEHGLELIKEISEKKAGKTVNILTHCNAGWLACGDWGTATSPIYHAFNAGIDIHVWVDETRPRNQGARLTAWELEQHGVPYTVIPDNTGGHLMQHGQVDICIVGSDRTTAAGDVANKIGTYLKALAAADNNVPFYVALPTSTIDTTLTDGIKEIEIEQRGGEEVKYMEGLVDGKVENVLIMPEESNAANYGFDVTPARLVTGLITENGICEANIESIKDNLNKK